MPYISCNLKHLSEGNISMKDTGLGNTLFQFATMFALYKKHGFDMDLTEIRQYCEKLKEIGYDHDKTFFQDVFRFFENKDVDKKINYEMITEDRNKPESYDKNFVSSVINNKSNHIKINGYLQSFMYFNDYRCELYNLFKPPRDFEEVVKIDFPELFNEDVVSISIHVRMNYANAINYTDSFFKESIKYFQNKYKNIHLFIFSNNHEEIKEWFNDPEIPTTFVSHREDYKDLWVMSMCQHNIISHSTFAWWGAYLNCYPAKEVLFPFDSLRVWWGVLNPCVTNPERQYEHYLPEWKMIEGTTMYKY